MKKVFVVGGKWNATESTACTLKRKISKKETVVTGRKTARIGDAAAICTKETGS